MTRNLISVRNIVFAWKRDGCITYQHFFVAIRLRKMEDSFTKLAKNVSLSEGGILR